MRNIFFIVNNCVLNNIDYLDNEDIDMKRAKRPLSVIGEELAHNASTLPLLDNISSIYSSGFASALATAKYLSERLEVTIYIDSKLNERKIGTVNKQTNFAYFKENQEHDFNYKLPMGESFNMTKSRITSQIKEILKMNKDDDIAIFTHSLALTSFLSNFCNIEYNLDNDLILDFNEEPIPSVGDFGIIKLVIDDNFNVSLIEKINVND